MSWKIQDSTSEYTN